MCVCVCVCVWMWASLWRWGLSAWCLGWPLCPGEVITTVGRWTTVTVDSGRSCAHWSVVVKLRTRPVGRTDGLTDQLVTTAQENTVAPHSPLTPAGHPIVQPLSGPDRRACLDHCAEPIHKKDGFLWALMSIRANWPVVIFFFWGDNSDFFRLYLFFGLRNEMAKWWQTFFCEDAKSALTF